MNKQEDRKDGLKQILGENMWNSWLIGGGQLKKKVHQSFSYTSISFLVLGIFLCIQYDISEQISV